MSRLRGRRLPLVFLMAALVAVIATCSKVSYTTRLLAAEESRSERAIEAPQIPTKTIETDSNNAQPESSEASPTLSTWNNLPPWARALIGIVAVLVGLVLALLCFAFVGLLAIWGFSFSASFGNENVPLFWPRSLLGWVVIIATGFALTLTALVSMDVEWTAQLVIGAGLVVGVLLWLLVRIAEFFQRP